MVANGDCKSLEDANRMYEEIHCDGVMAARGILANPTLFSGEYETTPVKCVQDWLNLAYAADTGITFQCFHHHLTFMMEKLLRRKERLGFNCFSKKQQIYDFLKERFGIVPEVINEYGSEGNILCEYDDVKYKERIQLQIDEDAKRYNSENSCGKFFLSQLNDDVLGDDEDNDDDGLNCLFN